MTCKFQWWIYADLKGQAHELKLFYIFEGFVNGRVTFSTNLYHMSVKIYELNFFFIIAYDKQLIFC